MKAYQYLLFRIYHFYKDDLKQKDLFIVKTTTLSSTIICINVLTVYFMFNYFGLMPDLNTIPILILAITIGIVNYFWVVRKEAFLDMGFTKDKKGGYVAFTYITLSFLLFFLISYLGHARFI